MKKTFTYFLTLFVIGLKITFAQAKICSPLLMMMPRGTTVKTSDPSSHRPGDLMVENSDISQETRGRELTESSELNLSQQEARGPAVLTAEKNPFSLPSDEPENIDALTDYLKNEQIESITSRINFLKSNHSETDLINLLESYLHQYEGASDPRAFNEWLTDRISEQKDIVTSKQQNGSDPFDLRIQRAILNVLISERQTLNALLSHPPSIATARARYEIQSTHLASKSILESGLEYFHQQAQHARAIDEYSTQDKNCTALKRSYYDAIDRIISNGYSYHQAVQANKPLYQNALKAKRAFEACKSSLISTYGSLENANLLQQRASKACDAILKSHSYLDQKAGMLERIVKQDVRDYNSYCYHTLANINDLLAEDHSVLAPAAIANDQATIDHLNARISFLKQARLASRHQLDILHDIANVHLVKSFSLLQEAGRYFLSAYDLLKPQHPSSQSQESQKLADRGLDFINTALVFQMPPIDDKQSVLNQSELLDTRRAAKDHAEQVIQATTEEIRFYHAKIANFLQEKISSLTHALEISSLQKTVNPESPSYFFLQQTAWDFEQASNELQQLSVLSLGKLNSDEAHARIKAVRELKEKAIKKFIQIQKLLVPK